MAAFSIDKLPVSAKSGPSDGPTLPFEFALVLKREVSFVGFATIGKGDLHGHEDAPRVSPALEGGRLFNEHG
jgi:hypothetical protein